MKHNSGGYSLLDKARDMMISKYGLQWAFQYPKSQWDEWLKDPERAWFMEKELEDE